MKTIEYPNLVDKSKWPSRGPWDSEPDKVQWRDEATGLPCLIVRGPHGGLCGYVGVSRSHPGFGQDSSHESVYNVDVHGGLTFADKCSGDHHGICHTVECGEDDNVWWFGFDCAHLGDLTPAWDSRGHGRDHLPRHWIRSIGSHEVSQTTR